MDELAGAEPRVREWWVYNTAVGDPVPSISVECRRTGRLGKVTDYTLEEWMAAFWAPSHPYPWKDAYRVIEGQR